MSGNSDKAAIWDVDGTLVDTAELHFQAWQEVCRDNDRDFAASNIHRFFGSKMVTSAKNPLDSDPRPRRSMRFSALYCLASRLALP